MNERSNNGQHILYQSHPIVVYILETSMIGIATVKIIIPSILRGCKKVVPENLKICKTDYKFKKMSSRLIGSLSVSNNYCTNSLLLSRSKFLFSDSTHSTRLIAFFNRGMLHMTPRVICYAAVRPKQENRSILNCRSLYLILYMRTNTKQKGDRETCSA